MELMDYQTTFTGWLKEVKQWNQGVSKQQQTKKAAPNKKSSIALLFTHEIVEVIAGASSSDVRLNDLIHEAIECKSEDGLQIHFLNGNQNFEGIKDFTDNYETVMVAMANPNDNGPVNQIAAQLPVHKVTKDEAFSVYRKMRLPFYAASA